MAQHFQENIDLHGHELKNVSFDKRVTFPLLPFEGQIIDYTGTEMGGSGVYIYKNNVWINITNVDQVSEINIEIIATEDIVAFNPVTARGKNGDNSNSGHRGKIIGFAIADILNGFPGLIKTSGKIQNLDWSWITGERIFIFGTTLVNYAPLTGDFSQCLGIAINSNTINIQIRQAIRL